MFSHPPAPTIPRPSHVGGRSKNHVKNLKRSHFWFEASMSRARGARKTAKSAFTPGINMCFALDSYMCEPGGGAGDGPMLTFRENYSRKKVFHCGETGPKSIVEEAGRAISHVLANLVRGVVSEAPWGSSALGSPSPHCRSRIPQIKEIFMHSGWLLLKGIHPYLGHFPRAFRA